MKLAHGSSGGDHLEMRPWITLLGIATCALPLLGGGCLPYGGAQPLTVKGELISHQGLRGWWGLKLDHAICTLKDPIDPYGVAYTDVDELQLIFMNQDGYAKYKNLLNRSVSISGKLMGRTTGYHQTRVLIIVDEMASVDGVQAPKATAKEPRPLRDGEFYFASVTVLPRPASRVIKQVWDTDPVKPFADSDRYVEHMFNGPMDVMRVKCREGYRIESPASTTNSSIFQMDPQSPANPFWGVAVSDSERTNITVRCGKTH